MKLLLVTQVVDTEDTYLGFFHRWIEKLTPRFESIEVICLYEGSHTLPANVTVHSLGKERGVKGKGAYALQFLTLIWKLRNRYDKVFIHMNEEYVVLGALLWKILGTPIYLWRNHYAGSWRTALAAVSAQRVFHTSEHSYTARFRNAVRMPVGVDTERYIAPRTAMPGSILFLGRFSPSKRPHVLIEALGMLKERGVPFSASFYGSAIPEDRTYQETTRARVAELGLTNTEFFEGVPHEETPSLYAAHELYVNLAESGMLDKTLFEAAASGTKVIARSEDWKALAGEMWHVPDGSDQALAEAIERALRAEGADLKGLARAHSLDALVVWLCQEMGVE